MVSFSYARVIAKATADNFLERKRLIGVLRIAITDKFALPNLHTTHDEVIKCEKRFLSINGILHFVARKFF